MQKSYHNDGPECNVVAVSDTKPKATVRIQYSRSQLLLLRNCAASSALPVVTTSRILKHSNQHNLHVSSSRHSATYSTTGSAPNFFSNSRFTEGRKKSLIHAYTRSPDKSEQHLSGIFHESDIEDRNEISRIAVQKLNAYSSRSISSNQLLPAFAKKNFQRPSEQGDQSTEAAINHKRKNDKPNQNTDDLGAANTVLLLNENEDLSIEPSFPTSIREQSHAKFNINERRIGSGRLMRNDDIWALKRQEVDSEAFSVGSSSGNFKQSHGKSFSGEPTTYDKVLGHSRTNGAANKFWNTKIQNEDRVYKMPRSNVRRNEQRYSTDCNASIYKRNSHTRKMHDLEEPEWFSEGPTSQSDTVELRGFDDSEDNFMSGNESEKITKQSNLQIQEKIEDLEQIKNTKGLKKDVQTKQAETLLTSATELSNGDFSFDVFLNFGSIKSLSGVDGFTNPGKESRFSHWFEGSQDVNQQISDEKRVLAGRQNNEENQIVMEFFKSSLASGEHQLRNAKRQSIPSMPSVNELEAQMQKQANKRVNHNELSDSNYSTMRRNSQRLHEEETELFKSMFDGLSVNHNTTSQRLHMSFENSKDYQKFSNTDENTCDVQYPHQLNPPKLLTPMNSPNSFDKQHQTSPNKSEDDVGHFLPLAAPRSSTPGLLFTPTSVLRKMTAEKEGCSAQPLNYEHHREIPNFNFHVNTGFSNHHDKRLITQYAGNHNNIISPNQVSSSIGRPILRAPLMENNPQQARALTPMDKLQISELNANFRLMQPSTFPQNYVQPIVSNNMHQQQHYQQQQTQNYNHYRMQNSFQIPVQYPPHVTNEMPVRRGNDVVNQSNLHHLPQPQNQILSQWFSPELLAKASAGKLPSLRNNQALSLEEFERNIQQSSANVHY